MATHDKPAYVPFFEETLVALSNLSPDDVASYVKAIKAYVYDGIEPDCSGGDPNCTGAAMAVFAMGRYQLDKTIKRSATNRANARARRERKRSESGQAKAESTSDSAETKDEPEMSEPVANGERDVSDAATTAEPEMSEPVANGERDVSNIASKNEQPAIYSKLQTPNSNNSSSSSNAPPAYEIPDLGAWTAYFNAKCSEKGIPPSSEAAERAWGYYEDHGWCHKDGTGFKSWHRQCSTCVKKYQTDLQNGLKGGRRRGKGNARGGHFSDATRRFDQDAINVESF